MVMTHIFITVTHIFITISRVLTPPTLINTSAIAQFNHFIMNATTQFNYFEDVFATVISVQVYDFLPSAIEKNCYGCRIRSSLQSKHVVCQMEPKNLVYVCFHDALNLIDKERAELHFHTYVHPTPDFVYTKSWYENLWSNQDSLQLVEYRTLQHRKL